MTFTDALSALFDDSARVTRAHWNNRRIYLEVVDYILCIHGYVASGPDDGLPHPWHVTEQDYFADDWQIVEPD